MEGKSTADEYEEAEEEEKEAGEEEEEKEEEEEEEEEEKVTGEEVGGEEACLFPHTKTEEGSEVDDGPVMEAEMETQAS